MELRSDPDLLLHTANTSTGAPMQCSRIPVSARGRTFFLGGSGEIRTLGPVRDYGFQDRCLRPLGHASIATHTLKMNQLDIVPVWFPLAETVRFELTALVEGVCVRGRCHKPLGHVSRRGAPVNPGGGVTCCPTMQPAICRCYPSPDITPGSGLRLVHDSSRLVRSVGLEPTRH